MAEFFADEAGDQLLASLDLEALVADSHTSSSKQVNSSVEAAKPQKLQILKDDDEGKSKDAADQLQVTWEPTEPEIGMLGKHFMFPFEPYSIQLDLMRCLHSALRLSRCGIFESPTGTGKSMSLICSSLTWLAAEIEQQRRLAAGQCSEAGGENGYGQEDASCDWVAQFAARKAQRQAADEKLRYAQLRVAALQRLEALRASSANSEAPLRERQHAATASAPDIRERPADESDEFLLPDLPTDADIARSSLLAKEEEEEEGEEEEEVTKIIYTSRTHSQLAQFSREFSRTQHSHSVSTICIGSRQNLCINASVTALRSASLINERCLELRRGAKASSSPQRKRRKLNDATDSPGSCGGCPYYRTAAIDKLAEAALRQPLDIEDLLQRGKQLSACPYYAARRALPLAQLVLLPYQCLIHKPTRAATGVRLAGQVVIVDEAHNLLETIASAHSHSISEEQMRSAAQQLGEYEQRYRCRLGPQNLRMVRQLQLLLRRLQSTLSTSSRVMAVSEFHLSSGIDNLDLHDLLQRLKATRLSRRLCGLAASRQMAAAGQCRQAPLLQLQAFLESILSSDEDGRVLISERQVKFLLLNPGRKFTEVVRSCRSVLLAGGTMRPVQDVVAQLFAPAGCRGVQLFSCGHVVAKDAVLPLVIGEAAGRELRFTHAARDCAALLAAGGQAAAAVLSAVPGGAVLFFPSYEWEQRAYKQWQRDGVLARICEAKPVLREPRTADQTDRVLHKFQLAVTQQGGAVLFAVVGGRLSEGINFSDDLGRCVLMLGMPFPNKQSPELIEKMRYLNEHFPPGEAGRSAGDSYYTNLCMRAVNQCIGRAIRHRGDYAAIAFLDCRYARRDIVAKLPDWIAQSLVPGATSERLAADRLRRFFADKRQG